MYTAVHTYNLTSKQHGPGILKLLCLTGLNFFDRFNDSTNQKHREKKNYTTGDQDSKSTF